MAVRDAAAPLLAAEGGAEALRVDRALPHIHAPVAASVLAQNALQSEAHPLRIANYGGTAGSAFEPIYKASSNTAQGVLLLYFSQSCELRRIRRRLVLKS